MSRKKNHGRPQRILQWLTLSSLYVFGELVVGLDGTLFIHVSRQGRSETFGIDIA